MNKTKKNYFFFLFFLTGILNILSILLISTRVEFEGLLCDTILISLFP